MSADSLMQWPIKLVMSKRVTLMMSEKSAVDMKVSIISLRSSTAGMISVMLWPKLNAKPLRASSMKRMMMKVSKIMMKKSMKRDKMPYNLEKMILAFGKFESREALSAKYA